MIGRSPAARRPRHRTQGRRLSVVAVLVAAVAGWGALTFGTVAPAQAAACGTTTGVTVVVDFGSLGGGVRTGCASAPSSGLSALTGAGHSYTFVPRQAGMVCTIDRRPDPCNGAPVSAYWSYWHASPGGGWTYSTVGAGSYRPRAGSVEGWAFSGGRPPSVRPPGAPKPTTSATPKPTARTTTATAAPRVSTPAPKGSVAVPSRSAAVPTGSTARPSPSGSTAASPSSTTAGTGPSTAVAGAPSASPSPSGDATDNVTGLADTTGTGDSRTLILGALLIAAVGAGAGAIAWRRRSGR